MNKDKDPNAAAANPEPNTLKSTALAENAKNMEQARLRAIIEKAPVPRSTSNKARITKAESLASSWANKDFGSKIKDRSLVTSCAAKTEPETIVWGLPDWLPLRKLSVLAGPRKSGKSLIACAIAARFSQGGSHPAWPGQPSPGWGSVLILSTEDDFPDTIVPRLIAAGANLDRIYNIDGISRFSPTRPFSFADEDDVKCLCAFAEEIGDVGLIILDPISQAIDGDASSNSKAQSGYVKVAALAKRLNAAILGIAHVVKSAKGKGALNRVAGPLALGGVARCVMVTCKIEGG